jgi:hypothetical protein
MSPFENGPDKPSHNLRTWISNFDDEVALEIGRLVLAFSHLEFTFKALIAERMGLNDGDNLAKVLLMTSGNTFSQDVQLFRSLEQTPGVSDDALELDKLVSKSAINASTKRNEVVHAWYLEVGDDVKIFMHWKPKPTATYGYSTRAGPLDANMVRDALDQVLSAFPVIQDLPEYERIFDKGD